MAYIRFKVYSNKNDWIIADYVYVFDALLLIF